MCVGVVEVNKGSLFWNRIFSDSEGGRRGKRKKVRNENKKIKKGEVLN